MSAPTDKDYIDAKLQAVMEKMNGDIRAHQITTDARLEKLETTFSLGMQTLESNFQHGLELLREEFNTRLAQMENNFHRTLIDVVKWMIGAMVGLTAISVTVTSVLFLRLAPKEEPALKARTSAVSSPLPAPVARGVQKWRASSMTAGRSAMLPAIRRAAGAPRTAR